VLIAFVREVQGQGVRVRGLIQRQEPDMHLVDVQSGQEFAITQDLGPDSDACRIDPAGFAEASVVLRNALAEKAELVVINRFGKLEAAGGGLAAEMLAVMAEGLAVLTCVNGEQVAAWRSFTGDAGLLLPPDITALRAWWRAQRSNLR
jgi:hypothetical protein